MIAWDEAKRKANLEKHGLDFADAHMVYDSPNKVTFLSRRKEEDRKQDIAIVAVDRTALTLIYTECAADVRVISFRVASRQERKIYEEAQEYD